MTEKEIIEALELCQYGEYNCDKCPINLTSQGEECTDDLRKYALELINRQREEIERLDLSFKFINAKYNSLLDIAEKTRAEVIKEFAEKLKEDIRYRIDATGDFELYEVFQDIDNLVKEMAGADNG